MKKTPPKTLPNHSIPEFLHKNIFDNDTDFSLCSCFYHDNELKFPIGMHKHSFYEINIVVNGSGYHYIEHNCIEATPGCLYVIPPNIMHGYWTNNESEFKIFNILLSAAFIERYKNELFSTPGYSTLFEIEPFLRIESSENLFLVLNKNEIESFSKDFDTLTNLKMCSENNLQIIGKVLYLLGEFSKLITIQHKHATKNKYSSDYSINIVKTIDYMKKNYFEKITVDDLAHVANMSKSTYLRQFKILCKCTPSDYLTEIRINIAKNKLKESELSITSIAQDCGFFDSSHFSKCFKKTTGILPLNYRKS